VSEWRQVAQGKGKRSKHVRLVLVTSNSQDLSVEVDKNETSRIRRIGDAIKTCTVWVSAAAIKFVPKRHAFVQPSHVT
jgi:hypothetical protein